MRFSRVNASLQSRVLFSLPGLRQDTLRGCWGVSERGPERPEEIRRANSRPAQALALRLVETVEWNANWYEGLVDPCGRVAARLPPGSDSAPSPVVIFDFINSKTETAFPYCDLHNRCPLFLAHAHPGH
jgi:hypothetical protein